MTFAPKLEVVETESEAAEVMAALRSRVPVIAIAPKAPLVPPPTMPLNSTSDDPTLKLSVLASDASEFTVLENVT